MTEQEKTINRIEQTMRSWIENNLSVYEQMPPAQTMTSTQGEKVLKANPATQEIRAAFADYCRIVKIQKELADGSETSDESIVDEMRSRFRLVK